MAKRGGIEMRTSTPIHTHNPTHSRACALLSMREDVCHNGLEMLAQVLKTAFSTAIYYLLGGPSLRHIWRPKHIIASALNL